MMMNAVRWEPSSIKRPERGRGKQASKQDDCGPESNHKLHTGGPDGLGCVGWR